MQPTLEQRLAARTRPEDQRQVMYQSWRDLLFLHWEVDAQEVQASLPPGLTVDTWNGKAYLGVVPFLMRDIRPKYLPAVPGISNFHETNLRTYVFDRHGRPGVWFYSLDADQWLAVRTARTFFQLPYFDAVMSHSKEGNRIQYSTQRKKSQSQSSQFDYQIGSELGEAEPGSFEFFLVERYLLFAYRSNQQLYSGQVVHPPYVIHDVDLKTYDAGVISLAGFELPVGPPEFAHFSPGVDVDVFPIRIVD